MACSQQLRRVLRHNAELMMLSDLKQFLDKTVSLRITNGEIAKVKVRFVDDEYDDLIVDVLETSTPERYRNGAGFIYFRCFGHRDC